MLTTLKPARTSTGALFLSAALLLSSVLRPAAAQDGIDARAERRDDRVIIDVSLRVAAPVADVWAVLIDYDAMPRFVEGLKTSEVSKRSGQQFEVAQSGESRWGLFSFKYATVRAVELLPQREIRTRLVSGDFKRFDSVTQLKADGQETLVTYHAESVPTAWLPPGIGPGVIATQSRKFYAQIVTEVMRRRAAR